MTPPIVARLLEDGIWPEHQPVRFELAVEQIEDDAGLDA